LPEALGTIIGQMDSSKTEIQDSAEDLKASQKSRVSKPKKSRMKKLACWLLVDLAVAGLILGLLFYRPGRYRPLSPDSFRPGRISPYLTSLSSEIYNGAQLGEAFSVVVTEKGINDMLARWRKWPLEHEGVLLYSPAVVLTPGTATLMATANVKGMEFVVTVELQAKIDEGGLSHLKVGKLKIGAMNITPLARMIAKKMYAEQVGAVAVDTEAWQTKIVASLLNDESFVPVFPTGDNRIRVRVLKVTIQKGKLVLHLLPTP